MATFPTPDRAVRAAMRMREEMRKINENRGSQDLALNIGLHEGPCLAVTLDDRQGDTGALAVPVRKRGGRGGSDRSCGASLVFGAVARGRTGAIGGAPRGGERQPGLERSADGVGAGVAEPCRGRGSRRSRPAGGGRRTVPAG